MNPGGGLVALTPSPGGGVGKLLAFDGKELLNPEKEKHNKPAAAFNGGGEKKGMELFAGYCADVYLVVGSWL